MTHDELLEKLNSAPNADTCWKIAIIRAVVELHHEFASPSIFDTKTVCMHCTQDVSNVVYYPCLTIQAIEKELK